MAGRYVHAREGTNRREWNFATNHGKTQHQNTQNENTKSPPRVWGTWGYADADSPNEIRT